MLAPAFGARFDALVVLLSAATPQMINRNWRCLALVFEVIETACMDALMD